VRSWAEEVGLGQIARHDPTSYRALAGRRTGRYTTVKRPVCATLGFPTSARSFVSDPTDPPAPPGQPSWPPPPPGQPAARTWGWTSPPGPSPDAGPPPDAGTARPQGPPPSWMPYGPHGPVPPGLGPPARNPVPRPPGSPRMLRLELGLVLLLAFSPGVLGLLLVALGPENSSQVEAQVVPSLISLAFEVFLSFIPVLVIGYLLTRNREGW